MGKEEINAFLGSGTTYTGKLQFNGAVRIDGTFTGDVVSEGALIVGKDAVIEGNLMIGELLLAGKFIGKAEIARRTTVHRTGILQGTLRTQILAVEEGATLDAEIRMSAESPRAEEACTENEER